MRSPDSPDRDLRSASYLAGFALLAGCLLLAACSGAPRPVAAPSAGGGEVRVPVVLVPGITGSVLRDRESGEVLWGLGPEVIRPKDGGYALARPIGLPLDHPTRLEAGGVIHEMELFGGLLEKPIYGPVLDTFEANGWTLGDLDRPTPQADAYAFGYDWRADNVHSAGVLLGHLRRLARAREESPLVVDLVCQSNGAHICRYLAKYGDADLHEAEAGTAAPPAEVRIRKLVLVGTSNGGSLRILREVHRGRRYVPLIGRRMLPETLFTFPAIFQDLPAYRPQPLVDESGRLLDLDLFDAESWVVHGFSVFRPAPRRRMAERPDLFGSEDERIAHLRRSLDRARRLHRLLGCDVEGFHTRTYLIQNGFAPTPELAVLPEGGPRLLFTGDRRLRDRPFLRRLVTAPGDGHATIRSQQALSPQERRALGAPVFFVRGAHFELILEPASLRRMVEFLLAK